MKNPKDFETKLDLPLTFHDAIEARVGEDLNDLRGLSREDIVKHQLAWTIGREDWYDVFNRWLNKAGLEIVESKQINQ